MICPPGKSMIFYKKETEKIELVARPENSKVTYHMTGPDFRTHFEVEEETGAVKTVSGLGCDRRRRTASGSGDRCLECVRDPSSPCWMTIEAKDSGDPILLTLNWILNYGLQRTR